MSEAIWAPPVDPLRVRWRAAGVEVRAQHGPVTQPEDPVLGIMDNAEMAMHVIKLHNVWLGGGLWMKERS